jgi:hypothetical protein
MIRRNPTRLMPSKNLNGSSGLVFLLALPRLQGIDHIPSKVLQGIIGCIVKTVCAFYLATVFLFLHMKIHDRDTSVVSGATKAPG